MKTPTDNEECASDDPEWRRQFAEDFKRRWPEMLDRLWRKYHERPLELQLTLENLNRIRVN